MATIASVPAASTTTRIEVSINGSKPGEELAPEHGAERRAHRHLRRDQQEVRPAALDQPDGAEDAGDDHRSHHPGIGQIPIGHERAASRRQCQQAGKDEPRNAATGAAAGAPLRRKWVTSSGANTTIRRHPHGLRDRDRLKLGAVAAGLVHHLDHAAGRGGEERRGAVETGQPHQDHGIDRADHDREQCDTPTISGVSSTILSSSACVNCSPIDAPTMI